VSQPDILTDKKERSDFYIALGVILLAGTFLWYTTYGGQSDLEEIVSTEVQVDTPAEAPIYSRETIVKDSLLDGYHTDSDVVEALPARDQLDNKIGQVSEKVSDAYETTKDKIAEASHDMKASAAGVATTASTMVKEVSESVGDMADKVEDKMDDMKEDMSDLGDKMTLTSDEKEVEVVKEEVVTKAPPVLSESPKSDRTCHISVGLYKEQKNIDQLKYRLEVQGFDVYTKRFPRSTQVGVYVVCDSQEAESVLSEIRADFAKDAFIEERF